MSEYSKKMVPVPTINLFREQDAGKQPVLDVRNLGIDFGGLTAVDEFNMTIGPTEISGLIGPNGAGKTTIFNLLTSVYQPTRGSILVKGIDTKGMDTAKVNKLGVARTFQNIRLFGDMTALDNVKVGMHNEIKCSFFESIFRLPGYFKAEKKAMMLGDMLELGEDSLKEHIEVIKKVLDTDADLICLVGKEFFEAVKTENSEKIHHFMTSAELAEWIEKNPINGHTILIKGSRGTKMEKTVEKL